MTLTPALHTIVYLSTESHQLSTDELDRLVDSAQSYNQQHHITGALLYCDGMFMQCFEGSAADMDETYARIRRSSLHHGIHELLNTVETERAFPEWSMVLVRPSKAEMATLMDTPSKLLLRNFWECVKR